MSTRGRKEEKRGTWETYLERAFQRAEPHDLWAAGLARKAAKWFFEFTGYVIIVGALKYVADATASPLLDGFYWVALGMLLLYVYSLTNMELQVRPFVFLGDNMASRILNHVFNYSLGVVLFLVALGSIHVAVNEISKLQG